MNIKCDNCNCHEMKTTSIFEEFDMQKKYENDLYIAKHKDTIIPFDNYKRVESRKIRFIYKKPDEDEYYSFFEKRGN